jgi:ABC-type phosphate/phosphonate transport system substrate-binding protein
MMRVACMPWYALPETEAAQDAFWSVLAEHLVRCGVSGVPRHLTRGRPLVSLLVDPGLLFGQCCGYDLIYGFAGSVKLVATPRYDAPGCDGSGYRSFVLVRDDCRAATLDGLRGGVCAVNGFNSHSGTNALRALVAPLSHEGRFFSDVTVTGAHMDSLALVLAGKADLMAMDCVLHALLNRHRPASLAGTRILCHTDVVPAPPFVTSASGKSDLMPKLRAALDSALSDAVLRQAKAEMLLDGVDMLPPDAYVRIVQLEGEAIHHGYTEMHAVSGPAGRAP